jgi:hypothetical protein
MQTIPKPLVVIAVSFLGIIVALLFGSIFLSSQINVLEATADLKFSSSAGRYDRDLTGTITVKNYVKNKKEYSNKDYVIIKVFDQYDSSIYTARFYDLSQDEFVLEINELYGYSNSSMLKIVMEYHENGVYKRYYQTTVNI